MPTFEYRVEEKRADALRELALLDTLPEKEFDDLVWLASTICNVPTSLISLIDEERQWFKASIGTSLKETHRNLSFCAHAIQHSELFVVEDTTRDPRFSRNALVTGPPHIRFYAGVPVCAPNGSNVGTLCVLDDRPRQLNETQKDALVVLAHQVEARMELRIQRRQLERSLSELEEARRAKTTLTDQLAEANQQLVEIATIDSLTGMKNRRAFETRAEIDFAAAKRSHRPLSLLVMDMDNFKQRNDTLGHAAGDEALRVFGAVVRGQTRIEDTAARLGGEEFAFILTGTDADGAMEYAARIQSKLRGALPGQSDITVSVGAATIDPSVQNWQQLLCNADDAMYVAKRAGKDRAIHHQAHLASLMTQAAAAAGVPL